MMRLLLGPLPWLALSALLALGLTWSCQRAGNLHQEIGGLERDLGQTVAANDVQTSTIAEQAAALDMWTHRAHTAARRRAVAVRNLTAAQAELAQATEQVRVEREVIFRQPECAELALLDVAKICPPLAESLREWAVRR